MISIIRVTNRLRDTEIRELESEYFTWVNTQLKEEFTISLNIDAMIAHDFTYMEEYFPPYGGLFLAQEDNAAVGMIFLAKLREGVGQLRRMYVRPAQRRHGIGRLLCQTAIHEARSMGYDCLLLESPMSWTSAHDLYHALGFEAVVMYPESEVPEELRHYWVFMQLKL